MTAKPETTAVDDLVNRSFRTYKIRLKSYQRITHRANAWDGALVASSTSSLVVSTTLLAFPEHATAPVNTLVTIVSLLTLIVSLVVTGVGYRQRANDMFVNYRAIQRFSAVLEAREKTDPELSPDEILRWAEQYQTILDFTENQADEDYEPARSNRQEESESVVRHENSPQFLKARTCAPWRESLYRSARHLFFSFVLPSIPWVISGLVIIYSFYMVISEF